MSARISPPTSHGSGAVERCQATPNCPGTILDGYCTVCGRVAGRTYTAPTVTAATTTTSDPGTTGPGIPSSDTTGPGSTSPGTGRPGTFGTSRPTRTLGPNPGMASGLSTSVPRLGSRRRSGSGVVELPYIPPVDPSTAVMQLPLVPEEKRFCSGCGAEVGRARDGRAARPTGFCSKCRHPFSFVPTLAPGDLLADQYRVLGCLAYGGLGWIYLAQDERVSNRWVVLKGLLNSGDAAAMAVALAERQFLARVEHPNVVRIYNVVQHADAGYIVMEYVGGMTLKNVLKDRRLAAQGPLPLDLGIAYVLAILPAFSYLHDLGLVYNDFKPDNVMLQADDVKLIDLGAVTRLDDPDPIVYGTDGYQAPELAVEGPSISADLYSVARCLAVMVLDLTTYQTTHRYRLPTPEQEPLFQRHESFYRFLLKATARDRARRYQSADEMADALEAVLHEVSAVTQGSPRPVPSKLFSGDPLSVRGAANGASVRPDWRYLPSPRVDPADPSASLVLNALVLEPAQQVATLHDAIAQGLIQATPEADLALARALIEVGRYAEADSSLSRVESVNGREWRGSWYRALSLLAQRRAAEAGQAFEAVYSELPGEPAPKLGIALAAELSGDLERAARHYEIVASADPSFTSACFGLARVRLAQGDLMGAVDAYERIPPASSLYPQAQLALARTLIRGGPSGPTVDDLAQASVVIERLQLPDEQRAELAVALLEPALALIIGGAVPRTTGVRLLGQVPQETPVRLALERAYRDLAWLAASEDEKIRLVDRANLVRPVTAV